LEIVDFLEEVAKALGNSLNISALWLNPVPKSNKNSAEPDYSLVIAAEFSEIDLASIRSILVKHNLEMKQENSLWLISDAA
jgi:hypothetical protein